MTDRDHGDDELEPGSGETIALAGRAHRRTKRRSLRVPVDEVPRRPSHPDGVLLTSNDRGDRDDLPPPTAGTTEMAEDLTSSVEIGVDFAELDLPEDLAEELDEDATDALESEPTRIAPPRRHRDTIVSSLPDEPGASTEPSGSAGPTPPSSLADTPLSAAPGEAPPSAPEPVSVPSAGLPEASEAPAAAAPPSGAQERAPEDTLASEGASGAEAASSIESAPVLESSPALSSESAPPTVPPPDGVVLDGATDDADVPRPIGSRTSLEVPPPATAEPLASSAVDDSTIDGSTIDGSAIGETAAVGAATAGTETTTPGSVQAPEPAPAVIVARVVAISSPPPPPEPPRASLPPPPPPAAIKARPEEPVAARDEDEPELSISEALDELEVEVGDDDRSASPDDDAIPDELSASEIELPDGDELASEERLPPPPPVAALASAADAEAHADAEELAPDDLEVEASGETTALGPEESSARRLRSAPPPPPEKLARIAPPPPVAAPPPPVAAPPPPAAPPPAPSAAAAPAAPPAAGSTPVPAAADATERRARKKGEWWDGFFNDDYLRTVPPPNPRQIARQCDFIEARLALKPGSTILDVGCGLGLHAIELTRRGYLVVGLDLSLAMLSRAADEAQDQGFRINFLHADMREMNFDGAFDAVLCWGTTFGYFDDDQNRAVVERLHRALRPKGKLLLEVVNRDFVVPNQPNLVWFEGDGCVVMEETQVNFITSRLTVKRTVILDDGRQRENAYSVRLYALHELGQVLHQRGFRVIEVTGREATPGVFFGADSPKIIILAERRAQNQTPPTPPKKPATESGEGAPTGETPTPEPEGSAEG